MTPLEQEAAQALLRLNNTEVEEPMGKMDLKFMLNCVQAETFAETLTKNKPDKPRKARDGQVFWRNRASKMLDELKAHPPYANHPNLQDFELQFRELTYQYKKNQQMCGLAFLQWCYVDNVFEECKLSPPAEPEGFFGFTRFEVADAEEMKTRLHNLFEGEPNKQTRNLMFNRMGLVPDVPRNPLQRDWELAFTGSVAFKFVQRPWVCVFVRLYLTFE